MADHHVGHLLCVGVLGEHIADETAVAQNGNTVGYRLDLVHLVGNDDYRLAVVAHVAQNRKQLIGLLRGQNGGRLIENEDIRTAVKHLDYLDRLLLRNGHVVYLLIRVDIKAVLIADSTNTLGNRLKVVLLFKAEGDILRCGEYIDELKVLMYHADAEVKGILRRTDIDKLIIDIYLALIGTVNAREHIHERGLAAAVFAEQRQHLATVDIQPYLVVCKNGTKALGYITHFYGRGSFFHCAFSFIVLALLFIRAKLINSALPG